MPEEKKAKRPTQKEIVAMLEEKIKKLEGQVAFYKRQAGRR